MIGVSFDNNDLSCLETITEVIANLVAQRDPLLAEFAETYPTIEPAHHERLHIAWRKRLAAFRLVATRSRSGLPVTAVINSRARASVLLSQIRTSCRLNAQVSQWSGRLLSWVFRADGAHSDQVHLSRSNVTIASCWKQISY